MKQEQSKFGPSQNDVTWEVIMKALGCDDHKMVLFLWRHKRMAPKPLIVFNFKSMLLPTVVSIGGFHAFKVLSRNEICTYQLRITQQDLEN